MKQKGEKSEINEKILRNMNEEKWERKQKDKKRKKISKNSLENKNKNQALKGWI